mmetsp:Transcript_111731/g.238691  ORF Transcript_111731/g.238691 Transcript_111731/m.238691 type:complete len:217 (+) Transcript_111731:90-740(+)
MPLHEQPQVLQAPGWCYVRARAESEEAAPQRHVEGVQDLPEALNIRLRGGKALVLGAHAEASKVEVLLACDDGLKLVRPQHVEERGVADAAEAPCEGLKLRLHRSVEEVVLCTGDEVLTVAEEHEAIGAVLDQGRLDRSVRVRTTGQGEAIAEAEDVLKLAVRRLRCRLRIHGPCRDPSENGLETSRVRREELGEVRAGCRLELELLEKRPRQWRI